MPNLEHIEPILERLFLSLEQKQHLIEDYFLGKEVNVNLDERLNATTEDE